jgi:fumarate hydratase class II
VVGYEKAAKIAHEAMAARTTVRAVARAQKVLSDNELERVLDPWRMTEPGRADTTK